MTGSANQGRSPRSPPWQPRFGIGTMMLVMLVLSVMAAAGSYLGQGLRSTPHSQLVFVLFTLAAPLILLTLVSLLHALFVSLQKKK